MPRLHPVYLPFRAQHQVLTLVQSVLEACCYDFGNAWVPELMEAQKWEEAESIELTRWVQKFSKHTKNVPLSATQEIPGKSLTQVLFETSSVRHSAVHRLRTSAAGIIKMLDAAVAFTDALRDTETTTYIARIRQNLAVNIENIVQHQTLLERKLSDELKDIARRRAELDDLEKLAVQDMLNNDRIHRTSAGSAVEDFLATLKREPGSCNSGKSSLQGDEEADHNLEEVGQTDDGSTSSARVTLQMYQALTPTMSKNAAARKTNLRKVCLPLSRSYHKGPTRTESSLRRSREAT